MDRPVKKYSLGMDFIEDNLTGPTGFTGSSFNHSPDESGKIQSPAATILWYRLQGIMERKCK